MTCSRLTKNSILSVTSWNILLYTQVKINPCLLCKIYLLQYVHPLWYFVLLCFINSFTGTSVMYSHIYFRVSSTVMAQSCQYHSASEVTLKEVDNIHKPQRSVPPFIFHEMFRIFITYLYHWDAHNWPSVETWQVGRYIINIWNTTNAQPKHVLSY